METYTEREVGYPAAALRRARKRRRMSQIALSEASGVAQRTISEIETGAREPYGTTLLKLADALDMDAAVFTERAQEPEDVSGWALTVPEEEFERRVEEARLDIVLERLMPLLESAIGAARNVGDEEAAQFALRRWQRAAREWIGRAGIARVEEPPKEE